MLLELAEIDLSENCKGLDVDCYTYNSYCIGDRLSGTIPHVLFMLPHLRELRLSENSLTGQIPITVRDATALEVLRLDDNKLTGNIPASLGRSTTLRTLRLGTNLLTGNIPEFSRSSPLEELDLGRNNFGVVGSIPGSIGRLSRLTDLSLRDNAFTGTIPKFIVELTKLEELRLEKNNLTGKSFPIPAVGSSYFLTFTRFFIS